MIGTESQVFINSIDSFGIVKKVHSESHVTG